MERIEAAEILRDTPIDIRSPKDDIYDKYFTAQMMAIEALQEPELPCKIGDTVYGIRRWHDTNVVKAGTVSEMFYTQNGKLMIVIKNVCRGHWGEKIFGTFEKAEAALKGENK